MTIKNILETIKKHKTFAQEYLIPQEAFALENIEKSDSFLPFVENWNFEAYGSDCIGGFAYFGSKSQIVKQIELLKNYLLKIEGKSNLPFGLVWHTSEGSMILFYEDYERDVSIVLNGGILSTEFGAWVDDETLDLILEDVTLVIDYEAIFFGENKFVISDEKCKQALRQARKIISLVKLEV